MRDSIFHGRFVYTVGTYRHATFTRDDLPIRVVDKDATDQRMDINAVEKNNNTPLEKRLYRFDNSSEFLL